MPQYSEPRLLRTTNVFSLSQDSETYSSEGFEMYYNDDAIAKLAEGYRALDAKLKNLMEAYVLREIKHPGAKEYATQGFPRRLKTLMRCIEKVFSEIPPERGEIPSRDELS